MKTYPHISVLKNEILHYFSGMSIKSFVDGTLGAGGHAEAILQAHPELTLFIGIDQDPTALHIAQERLTPWKEKLKLIQGNFGALEDLLKNQGVGKVDGILLDLGVSSMQFDRAEKGFSFMNEGPLDMRMNPEGDLTAGEIINTWSEQELGRIFREYGEEKKWRYAAKVILEARARKSIRTTTELADILRPIFPSYKKKGVNPLTLIFQALRICVNSELEMLEKALPQAFECLSSGGRLGVISFHSLEDRIVKNFFRFKASDKYDTSGIGGMFLDKDPEVIILSRKPLTPSEEEIEQNPRSRSAKLRFFEKI